MASLSTLLTSAEPEEKQKDEPNFGLNELHISEYAYQKAFRYAKLILKVKRGNNEVGGFLTTPEDAQDRVVRDVFLARNQVVSSVEYKLEPLDVLEAKRELTEEGQKIIGWWHSHGRGTTFHSPTDDRNQMVLLNAISPSNYIVLPKERTYKNLQSKVKGKNLIFWDTENPDTRYEIALNSKSPELVAKKLKVLENQRIGFAYSFVVNHARWKRKRKPYSEIATRDLCKRCMNEEDISIPVKHKIFNEGKFSIDDYQLIEEIRERVFTYGELRGKKTYFLPEVFEEKRASGTLTKPEFYESRGVIYTPPGEIE